MKPIRTHFFVGAALAGLLSACASTSYLRPGFQLADADALAFTSPISAIALVRTGYRTRVDSQATATSERLLRKALIRHRFQLGLQQELRVPDSLRLAARREIYRAVEGLRAHSRLAGGAQLPVLDYLLAAQRQRYLLVLAAAGFTQVLTKYDARLAQGLTTGQTAAARTPGPQPTATRAKSNLYLFLYDQQQQAIVYYTSTPPLAEREPLDEASLEIQISQLLRKDFPLPTK